MIKTAAVMIAAMLPLWGAAASAEDAVSVEPSLYLGLAVPIPDSVPAMILVPSAGGAVPNGSYPAVLLVKKNGKIKKVLAGPDSTRFYEPLTAISNKIRCRFLRGRKLHFPVAVPVRLEFSNNGGSQKAALRFPISTDLVSDTMLLFEFYERNRVTPPSVTIMPSLFYRFDHTGKEPVCLTMTAHMALDEGGRLVDLSFPGGAPGSMNHQVQVALMNAAFAPASLDGRGWPCEFWVTFRLFDNVRYPFTPSAPTDTTRTPSVTERFVMTRYFNPRDISICPLPRRYPSGIILTSENLYGARGTVRALVQIDSEGEVSGISIAGASTRLTQAARKAVKLTQWYPAVGPTGERESFSGAITLELDGSAQVVYIPEWVSVWRILCGL